jgi:ribosome-binding factor A
MMRPGRRARRVGEQILKEMAYLLLEKVKDPRVRNVTLTGIRLSNDLKQARVYFSVLGEEDQVVLAQAGMESAKGFIKREIGLRLSLRYVPDIRFIHDTSLAAGSHMERILDGLKEDG